MFVSEHLSVILIFRDSQVDVQCARRLCQLSGSLPKPQVSVLILETDSSAGGGPRGAHEAGLPTQHARHAAARVSLASGTTARAQGSVGYSADVQLLSNQTDTLFAFYFK